MNRIMAGIAALLMMFTLSACGDSDESTGESSESRSTESSNTSMDEKYLDVVHSNAPETYPVEDELLVDLAKSICNVLDTGGTVDEIIAGFIRNDFSVDAGGSILGAGIATYCPEHMSKLG